MDETLRAKLDEARASFPSCEGNVVSTSSSDNPHLQ